MTLAEIHSYRGQGEGLRAGAHLRFFCPIHGGDRQRSFKLNPETGHFKCYSCQEWGYLKEKHEQRRREWVKEHGGRASATGPKPLPVQPDQAEPPPNPAYEAQQVLMTQRLPGGLGALYLARRGIDPELARRYFGVGYAPDGSWPHVKDGAPRRQWRYGRVTFPHSNPAGDVLNFYGRAVGRDDIVPKQLRHDHLPGPKGIFNAVALYGDQDDTVYVCEGVFDALSLVMAGYEAVCAIFGVEGLRWNWVRAKRVVLCLDPDVADQSWRTLAYEGTVRGKEVFWIGRGAYQGHKDLNAVWLATGAIRLDGFEPTRAPIPRPSLSSAPASKLEPGLEDLLKSLETRGLDVDGTVYRYEIDVVAVTGRVSYQRKDGGPLVQQMPAAERLNRIRPLKSGRRFLVADYGQIEPRIVHALLKARAAIDWDAGEDLYRTLFGDLGDGRHEAKLALNRFINGGAAPELGGNSRLGQFVRAVRAYQDEIAAAAKASGYVSTLFGRPVPLEREAPNHAGRALNRVVQGTAADVFNQAAVALHRELGGRGEIGFLLHDEVWVEADAGVDLEGLAATVVRVMKATAKRVGVDLPVRIETGPVSPITREIVS